LHLGWQRVDKFSNWGQAFFFAAMLASLLLPATTQVLAASHGVQPDAQAISAGINADTARSANCPVPYALPPEMLRKAVVLSRLRIALGLGATAWTIFVLVLVLWLRWPTMLRGVERWTHRGWLQGLIFFPIAIVVFRLIPLPLEVAGHQVSLVYGLSVESWGAWSLDWIKSLLLSVVIFTLLLLLLFWIIRRSPRRWWFWFWLCVAPAILFGVYASPIWIDPMFNRFSPLEKSDPALALQLERLAHHAGLDIPRSRIFLMQASAKVTGLNAYVTGIGTSKRIVVWDTTANKLPAGEILFIVGHEMGHYVLNHIDKGLAFSAALLLLGFWIAWLVLGLLLRRYSARWGIRDQTDIAAIAVLALISVVLSFLSLPVANSFSRWEEHQADVFGQEAIHGLVPDARQTAVCAFDALGRSYLEAPDPNSWVQFWLGSHPSISQRVRFAAHYDPWAGSRHPRYFPR
jgi:Zn-dependent protease with chaperone function